MKEKNPSSAAQQHLNKDQRELVHPELSRYPTTVGDLTRKIKQRLITQNSGSTRRQLVIEIAHSSVPLNELLPILRSDTGNLGKHFSWVIGGLGESFPQYVAPAVPHLFEMRNQLGFPNFQRSVAKALMLAGIPESIEGAAADQLFAWLIDPNKEVTTKTYAAKALLPLTQKYPDLRGELRQILEDELPKNSISFQKTARQLLVELDRVERGN